MIKSPCKDCTERFTACHDHCPKDKRGEFGYKAWKEEVARINKARKEYVAQGQTIWSDARRRNLWASIRRDGSQTKKKFK